MRLRFQRAYFHGILVVASWDCSIRYWYLVDVLHVRHDSRFGVGRESLGLEGPAHYERIAVDKIRRYRLVFCGYFRARTIAGHPHGSSCIRLRFKGAAILELTESFG